MRSNNSRLVLLTFVMVAGFVTLLKFRSEDTSAQAASPTMLVPNLAVRTVVTGLVQPTSIAFIGDNDFLVLEKASGRVLRVEDGAVQSVVLDLAGAAPTCGQSIFPHDAGMFRSTGLWRRYQ